MREFFCSTLRAVCVQKKNSHEFVLGGIDTKLKQSWHKIYQVKYCSHVTKHKKKIVSYWILFLQLPEFICPLVIVLQEIILLCDGNIGYKAYSSVLLSYKIQLIFPFLCIFHVVYSFLILPKTLRSCPWFSPFTLESSFNSIRNLISYVSVCVCVCVCMYRCVCIYIYKYILLIDFTFVR
jgi:hypothetical protein